MKPCHINRTIFVVILIAGTLGVCLWRNSTTSQRKPTPPLSPPARQVPTPIISAPATATTEGYRWHVGQETDYDLTARMILGAWKDEPARGLMIKGVYHLRVLDVLPDEVLLGCVVSSASVLVDGRPQRLLADMFNRSPALVSMSPQGKVKRIGFAPEVADQDRRWLRIAYAWEMVLHPAIAYEEQELNPDSERTYISAYYRPSATSITKARRLLDTPANVGAKVLTSLFTAQLATEGWVQSLVGEEVLSQPFDSGNVASFVSARLVCLRNTHSATPSSRFTSFAMRTDALHQSYPTQANAQSHSYIEAASLDRERARYVALPLTTLLSNLRAAIQSGSMASRASAAQELASWIRVHGTKGASDVMNAVVATSDTDESGLLIRALGSANATTQLTRLLTMRGTISDDVLSQVMVESGSTREPSPDMVKALWQLASQPDKSRPDDYVINDTALLNLGRLSEFDASLQAQLTSRLEAWLSGGSSEQELALRVLANARASTATIRAAAVELAGQKSTDTNVRNAALDYLATLTGSLVAGEQDVILAGLLPDQPKNHQIAAMDAIASRDELIPLAQASLLNLSQSTSDSDIQSKAAGLLKK